MSQPSIPENPFINYLQSLVQREDRPAALAALRRGLGRPPGAEISMYPYVARFVPEKSLNRWDEKVYYLVAALFASYHAGKTAAPVITVGNLGNHMRQAAQGSEEATERRFTLLLSAHPDDLPNYLRHAISFLRSKEQPVNWQQLFRDLRYWSHPDRFVQRRWANAYWGFISPNETENQTTDQTQEGSL